jgi:hypothetical protein
VDIGGVGTLVRLLPDLRRSESEWNEHVRDVCLWNPRDPCAAAVAQDGLDCLARPPGITETERMRGERRGPCTRRDACAPAAASAGPSAWFHQQGSAVWRRGPRSRMGARREPTEPTDRRKEKLARSLRALRPPSPGPPGLCRPSPRPAAPGLLWVARIAGVSAVPVLSLNSVRSIHSVHCSSSGSARDSRSLPDPSW